MRSLNPCGELVDVAKVLIGVDSAPAVPSQSQIRRAISSAYYALFHALIEESLLRIIGSNSKWETEKNIFSRWYVHNDMRTVSRWIINRAAGGKLPDQVSGLIDDPSQELVKLANNFTMLQSARHEADYNHGVQCTIPKALQQIDRSIEAIALLPKLAGDRVYEIYLILLLGGPKIALRG